MSAPQSAVFVIFCDVRLAQLVQSPLTALLQSLSQFLFMELLYFMAVAISLNFSSVWIV